MAERQEIRIAVASENLPWLRQWGAMLRQEAGFDLAGEAEDLPRLLSLLEASRVEVLLLDAPFGTSDLLEEVYSTSPATRIAIVGKPPGDEYLCEALVLGVRGFLSRDITGQDCAKAIRALMAGDVWVARRTLLQTLESLLTKPSKPHEPFPLGRLTPREGEVVTCILQGMTNKQIGKRLGASDRTIKVHLNHIFKKTNISRRIQLLLNAGPGSDTTRM
ncbi:MAG: LuxR C-terminal-related transcriptional regulator [Gammaproteobacteria bacterium]